MKRLGTTTLPKRTGSNGNTFGYKHTKEAKLKIGLASKGRNVGPKNGNWKGGPDLYNKKIRHSYWMTRWAQQVRRRDKYTCQICFVNKESHPHMEFHSDHIKPFRDYPKLRFDLNNGRTLCVPCHKKITKEFLMRRV